MSNKPLIKKLISKAEKKYPSHKLFYEFIDLFFQKSSSDDLSALSVDEWVEIAYFHWENFRKVKANHINYIFKQSVYQSKNDYHFSLVMPDMPFIVDSIRNMFVRNNMQILDIINIGQLYVNRDKNNQVKSLGYSNAKGVPEAVLYIRMGTHLKIDSSLVNDIVTNVIDDIILAVNDWREMQNAVSLTIDDYQKLNLVDYDNQDEIIDFLIWFKEYFTFIGFREYRYSPMGKLNVKKDSELGVLKHKLKQSGYHPSQVSIPSQELISISKSSAISTVHRSVQTDLISVRVFDQKGMPIGEKRFVGLFTSDAFDSDPTKIPVLRQKVKYIIQKSDLSSSRFAEKKLLHILKTLPREELFQASYEELYRLVLGIFYLHEKFTYKVFIRADYHLRFISCFVFIPRNNYNTFVFKKINGLFEQEFNGSIVSSIPFISESALVRIHITLKTSDSLEKFKGEDELTRMVQLISESWQDRFKTALSKTNIFEDVDTVFQKYAEAFGAGYTATYSPKEAISDISKFEALSYENPIEFLFCSSRKTKYNKFQLKVFQLNEQKITLSHIIPMIENLGFNVINERSCVVELYENSEIYLNDIYLMPKYEVDDNMDHISEILLPYLYRLCNNEIENDLLNSFVISSSFSWQDSLILRVYCKYLNQLNFNLSEPYVHNCLLEQHLISSKIIQLFYMMFSPNRKVKETQLNQLKDSILEDIDKVKLLDHDRVLRMILGSILATVRTNFFFNDVNAVVIKIRSGLVPNIPKPAPLFESFVYATNFEGVHLRGGMVARGGLRWSDRREDFRTEVLGLMKAQQVKNAIIVPSGSKGGFVLKTSMINYDQWLKDGISAYQTFINSLLSITDNIVNNRIVKPKKLVCLDQNDPYLVVAADKGTAKFSDIANTISQERNFWLDDAFASGGRFGYDHKVLGITAKGAWESVIWHFRSLKIDINQPFSVTGVGDMSGDVFGNGMLLSNKIKLVAAFNHEAIFIDPNPDPKTTFIERKRLFKLPRSKWSDFDTSFLSKGGGIYSRAEKSIKISPEAQKALGVSKLTFTPNDLINAILKAPVDLFWNGGIGTYVKASTESNLDAKDKQNDSLRINGNQLRCKVVAEGGNLGFTQMARIEFAANGGLINTDFIDNSGGVDCSDIEVNSKILLNMLVQKGKLSYEERNSILEDITDEVCDSVLKDNRQQNTVISFAQHQCLSRIALYLDYIQWAELNGIIDRDLDGISDNTTIAQRKMFTRPELAIMFARTILLLKDQLANSSILKNKLAHEFLEKGISPTLVKKYNSYIKQHYLKEEIIATQLAKNFVFDMGVTFYHQMYQETQSNLEDVLKAYMISRCLINYNEVNKMVSEIEYKISTETFIILFDMYRRLLRRCVRILLNSKLNLNDVIKNIESFKKDALESYKLCKQSSKKFVQKEVLVHPVEESELQDPIVKKLFDGRFYWHIITIIRGNKETKSNMKLYSNAFFEARVSLSLDSIMKLIDDCDINDYVDNLTKITLKQDIEKNFIKVVDYIVINKIDVSDWIKAFENQHATWQNLVAEARGSQKNRLNLFVVLNRMLPNFRVDKDA